MIATFGSHTEAVRAQAYMDALTGNIGSSASWAQPWVTTTSTTDAPKKPTIGLQERVRRAVLCWPLSTSGEIARRLGVESRAVAECLDRLMTRRLVTYQGIYVSVKMNGDLFTVWDDRRDPYTGRMARAWVPVGVAKYKRPAS